MLHRLSALLCTALLAGLPTLNCAAASQDVQTSMPEEARLVVAQAREMIAWLDEREFVTIPDLCRETWRIKMPDKQAQRTLSFTAYGGQKMLVAVRNG